MDFLKNAAVEYGKQQLSGGNDHDYKKQEEQQQQQQISNTSMPGNLSGLAGTLLNSNIMDILSSPDDKKATAHAAASASGNPSDASLFHSVLNNLDANKHNIAQEKDSVDEDFAVKMFKKFVEKKDTDSTAKGSSDNLGAAAAMQAIKLFNSGSGSSSSSSGGQAALLGLALSEGSKLFDNAQAEGNVTQGTTKESVMQQAVQFALKFFLKSQSNGNSGSDNSKLLALASKFL